MSWRLFFFGDGEPAVVGVEHGCSLTREGRSDCYSVSAVCGYRCGLAGWERQRGLGSGQASAYNPTNANTAPDLFELVLLPRCPCGKGQLSVARINSVLAANHSNPLRWCRSILFVGVT